MNKEQEADLAWKMAVVMASITPAQRLEITHRIGKSMLSRGRFDFDPGNNPDDAELTQRILAQYYSEENDPVHNPHVRVIDL